jgi:hypothetical protein
MHSIALATEDELSEAVGLRLVEELSTTCAVTLMFRRSRFGYLKSRLDMFCRIARRQPVLLMTDLDNCICAPDLIAQWMGRRNHPQKLIFRVAVREVEAWLLADHVAMQALFGKKIRNLPEQPDTLGDPKRTLLTLARKAPRAIRKDLIVEQGTIASQGIGYNVRLCAFVRETWNPERAAVRSDSLRRVRERLEQLSAASLDSHGGKTS